MTNETHDEALDRAVALTRQVVAERYRNGRLTLGASLKPELTRQSYQLFDEQQLGFKRFLEFLRVAETRGAISLHDRPQDVEVTPPNAAPVTQPLGSGLMMAANGHATHNRSVRVRRDLWRGFVDWSEGLLRLYDRRHDRVVVVPMIPAPLEPAEFAELREAHRSGSPDFVVIEPLQLEQQLSWAREFATQTEGPLHILLGFALASERPLRDFSRAVKEDLAVGRRWAIFRMQRVADHIAAWAHANGLKLEIYADADSAPKLVEPADRRQLGPVREDLVRERLHAAIDRMPVSELLRLSLPLEYTIAFDD